MIYLIAGCVSSVILAIVLYYRSCEFRVKSANESKSLVEKYEAQLGDLRRDNEKIMQEVKVYSDKAQAALSELNNLHAAREKEVKSRINAERRVEMAMQKTEDMEDRIHDWNELQQAVIKDSMKAILQTGNDLYERMHKSYQNETDTIKGLLGGNAKIAPPSEGVQNTAPVEVNQTQNNIKVASETLSSLGLEVGKDYFLQKNFDAKLAPLMLCELVIAQKDALYFVDFKSGRYFDEYNSLQGKDHNLAQGNLQKRLDKYLSYLTNPKYNQSILKALSTKGVANHKVVNVFFVQSDGLSLLEKVGYQEKAEALGLIISGGDNIKNLIA